MHQAALIIVRASALFISLIGAMGATRAETSGTPGTARVCLEDDIRLPARATITLPATAVFEDKGPLSGKRENPATWGYEVKPGVFHKAAIITLAPAILSQAKRCAEVGVKMLLGVGWTQPAQKALDAHVFAMTDVLEYPVPDRKPPVEIGKLVDDISVKAILTADVMASTKAPEQSAEETARAAKCLEGAKKLASHLGGGLGRQTSMVVSIGGLAAQSVTYGCSTGLKDTPDVFVSWNGNARPSPAINALILNAGEFLTGAGRTELTEETAACVNAALKPSAGELADREFRGVKIECQAFARDDGGGSVTIYRRFGAYPTRASSNREEIAAMERTSAAVRAEEQRHADDTLSFAKWWQDPAISQEVKTFAMLTARVISLEERCPTAKRHSDKIASWAASAGVNKTEIQAGGKYFPLMLSMISAMRVGVQKENVEAACSAAKKYD